MSDDFVAQRMVAWEIFGKVEVSASLAARSSHKGREPFVQTKTSGAPSRRTENRPGRRPNGPHTIRRSGVAPEAAMRRAAMVGARRRKTYGEGQAEQAAPSSSWMAKPVESSEAVADATAAPPQIELLKYPTKEGDAGPEARSSSPPLRERDDDPGDHHRPYLPWEYVRRMGGRG